MGCLKMTKIMARINPAAKQPKSVLTRLIDALLSGGLMAIIECPYALVFERKLNIIRSSVPILLFWF
jgi:hypothetical protein